MKSWLRLVLKKKLIKNKILINIVGQLFRNFIDSMKKLKIMQYLIKIKIGSKKDFKHVFSF